MPIGSIGMVEPDRAPCVRATDRKHCDGEEQNGGNLRVTRSSFPVATAGNRRPAAGETASAGSVRHPPDQAAEVVFDFHGIHLHLLQHLEP